LPYWFWIAPAMGMTTQTPLKVAMAVPQGTAGQTKRQALAQPLKVAMAIPQGTAGQTKRQALAE
jgi:hypothetical protein